MRPIGFALTLAGLFTLPATAQDSPVVKFVPTDSVRHDSNGISLASFLSATIATQNSVSEGFEAELRRALNGSSHWSRDLVTLQRDESGKLHISFDGSPEPRKDMLVPSVLARVKRCFATLTTFDERWAFVRAVDSGIVGNAANEVAAATAASRKMFETFVRDGCAIPAELPDEAARVTLDEGRMFLSLRALLGVAMHPEFAGGSQYVNMVTATTPLLFVERGIWVRVQQAEVRSLLETAFKKGFLSDATLGTLRSARFTTFVDAALKVRSTDAEVSLSALKPFVERCNGSTLEAAFASFDYGTCLSTKPVREVRVEIGNRAWVTVEGQP